MSPATVWTCCISTGCRRSLWLWILSRSVNCRKGDDSCSIIGGLSSGEGGGVLTGEGDEILIANVCAGFGADDEEDVGTGAKAGREVLMPDDRLPANGASEDAASLPWVCWGDDGREKGSGASDDLLGVNGAAIVLVDV